MATWTFPKCLAFISIRKHKPYSMYFQQMLIALSVFIPPCDGEHYICFTNKWRVRICCVCLKYNKNTKSTCPPIVVEVASSGDLSLQLHSEEKVSNFLGNSFLLFLSQRNEANTLKRTQISPLDLWNLEANRIFFRLKTTTLQFWN